MTSLFISNTISNKFKKFDKDFQLHPALVCQKKGKKKESLCLHMIPKVNACSGARACLCVCACRWHHWMQCGQADKGDDGALIKRWSSLVHVDDDRGWQWQEVERWRRRQRCVWKEHESRKEGERGRILTLWEQCWVLRKEMKAEGHGGLVLCGDVCWH